MARSPSRKRESNPSVAAPPQPASATRQERILVWIVTFYVAVLVMMVAFNRYAFIMKSLIVPVLLLAAVLSGRLKRFVNDWVVFVAAVEFFEFGRGLAYALTSHLELPMHLAYVLRFERWLCGGAIAPEGVQQLRARLTDTYWPDRFFVLIYSSHFLFFLVFGLIVWSTRRPAFRAYAWSILGVLYGGLAGYFLVPTIPPWMAANDFLVIPPITQLVRTLYNVHVPRLVAAFDVNTIAAMPSVHAAIPAACALFAWRHYRRRSLPVVIYAVLVWIAVIYLGEHYLTDVLAGILLALVIHIVVSRWIPVSSERVEETDDERWQVQPIAIALTLVAAAYGFGQLTARWIGPLPITQDFVERNLLGKSPLAHYYLGRIAHDHKDFHAAEVELAQSLNELSHPDQQKVIRAYLGISAYRNGNLANAIRALEPQRARLDDLDSLVLLSQAYVDNGQYDDAVALLHDMRNRFADAPEPLYWLARQQYLHGDVDRARVAQVIDALKQYPPDKADPLRLSLSDLLRQGRTGTGG
ncbi:MAG: phosphatase PAP2 family protein [Deltaproteobacteria bacterium]|nr:phosphatase PAP2 family protein [Deltaproteobacteria bacterium]